MARQSVERDKLQDFARTGFAGYRRVEVRREKSGTSFWWIVLLAVASFGLWLGFQPDLPADDLSTAVSATQSNSERSSALTSTLESRAWRTEISALEVLLFSPPELDRRGPITAHAATIRETLEAWARSLENTGGAQEAALADDLGDLVERTRRSDFNVRRLADLKNAWLSVRVSHLTAAPWWQKPEPRRQRTNEFVVYRGASENLRGLVEDTMWAGEALVDDDSLPDDERQRRWQGALKQLGADIEVLHKSLPQRPLAGAKREVTTAIYHLDAALEASRRLRHNEQGLVTPFRHEPFEGAILLAEEAADQFANLL